jgi:regulator of sirC expression with transglutaminase-like and TPR domain
VSNEAPEEIRRRFAEVVSRDDERVDLAKAALLIAAEEYPRIETSLYLEKLDRIADLAREQAAGAETSLDFITAINTTLFDELRFRGNIDNYYDPRNSYLNEVIDRRTGIPITLAVVYMEVARRIGFAVDGVGLPGHFIVKHSDENGEVFIDVFNRGRLLGEVGCADLLASLSRGKLVLRPEHLLPATRKQILTRLLSNILGIYSGTTDYHRALAAIERILLINPDSLSHIRDHGLLLAAAGKTTGALDELERYLTLSPEAPDAEAIAEQMKSIKQDQAKLN